MRRPLCIVTGKNGQLGRCLSDVADGASNISFLFFDKSAFDITNEEHIKTIFEKYQPNFLINAAAYTAVDKAETEMVEAYASNTEAPSKLAYFAYLNHCRFIHISTDYVFDGLATIPYSTSSTPSPLNYYGFSKWQGEQLALGNNPESIIIRTSWVYSEYGNNFVKTMMRLMQEKKELNIVYDQVGCPTYAGDLATSIVKIVNSLIGENILKTDNRIYHYSNKGQTNWYKFATAIKKYFQYNCLLHPIPTSSYPTPAQRPMFSLLNTELVQKDFSLEIPFWQDSLAVCLGRLK